MYQIKKGTTILAQNGDKVGKVVRVVMDPRSQKITHLIVQKGWLFTEDKVLNFDQIDSVNVEGDNLVLISDIESLDQLPPYKEVYFVPVDEADENVTNLEYVPIAYLYPPAGQAMWGGFPITYGPPYMVKREEFNIPDDGVELKLGANVVSADGKNVGSLAEVVSDPDTGYATHLILSHGTLVKDKKLIPTLWIDATEDGSIKLAVNSVMLDRLPEYDVIHS